MPPAYVVWAGLATKRGRRPPSRCPASRGSPTWRANLDACASAVRIALLLLHAASDIPTIAPVLFTLAGFASRARVGSHKQVRNTLNELVELRLLSKTGPRQHREYAITATGLAYRQASGKPAPRPLRPICRMCGSTGGRHWRDCPIDPRSRPSDVVVLAIQLVSRAESAS